MASIERRVSLKDEKEARPPQSDGRALLPTSGARMCILLWFCSRELIEDKILSIPIETY